MYIYFGVREFGLGNWKKIASFLGTGVLTWTLKINGEIWRNWEDTSIKRIIRLINLYRLILYYME